MISKMHVDMDLNTKAVRHVTENDQVVNNILKGLEKTIIDLSHTNESESIYLSYIFLWRFFLEIIRSNLVSHDICTYLS
jgi:hypothetical protein